jgi:hypothetical protein
LLRGKEIEVWLGCELHSTALRAVNEDRMKMGSAGVLACGRWGDVGEDEFTAETPRRRVFLG